MLLEIELRRGPQTLPLAAVHLLSSRAEALAPPQLHLDKAEELSPLRHQVQLSEAAPPAGRLRSDSPSAAEIPPPAPPPTGPRRRLSSPLTGFQEGPAVDGTGAVLPQQLHSGVWCHSPCAGQTGTGVLLRRLDHPAVPAHLWPIWRLPR